MEDKPLAFRVYTEEQRRIFDAYVRDRKTLGQIALETGLKQGAVQTRFNRIREELRVHCNVHGYTYEIHKRYQPKFVEIRGMRWWDRQDLRSRYGDLLKVFNGDVTLIGTPVPAPPPSDRVQWEYETHVFTRRLGDPAFPKAFLNGRGKLGWELVQLYRNHGPDVELLLKRQIHPSTH